MTDELVPSTPDDPEPVSAESSSPGRAPSRRLRRGGLWVVLALVMVAGLVAGRPSGYLSVEPGPAPVIAVIGAPENTDGVWRFTTVRATPLRVGEYWWAKVTGTETAPISIADPGANTIEMWASKAAAWTVAGRVLGEQDTPAAGALVVRVTPGSPAATAGLVAGDIIAAVGGMPVANAGQIADVVSRRAGTATELTTRAGSDVQTKTVTPDSNGRMGVELGDLGSLAEPGLEIDSQGAGGPSAGLMFTLAYIEARGGGDLRAGRDVAGTGTIELDGDVGEVGGVAYKVQGAERAGAEVFFVPVAEMGLVGTTSLEVVPVRTVLDAVAWLCARGGTSPACGVSAL